MASLRGFPLTLTVWRGRREFLEGWRKVLWRTLQPYLFLGFSISSLSLSYLYPHHFSYPLSLLYHFYLPSFFIRCQFILTAIPYRLRHVLVVASDVLNPNIITVLWNNFAASTLSVNLFDSSIKTSKIVICVNLQSPVSHEHQDLECHEPLTAGHAKSNKTRLTLEWTDGEQIVSSLGTLESCAIGSGIKFLAKVLWARDRHAAAPRLLSWPPVASASLTGRGSQRSVTFASEDELWLWDQLRRRDVKCEASPPGGTGVGESTHVTHYVFLRLRERCAGSAVRGG